MQTTVDVNDCPTVNACSNNGFCIDGENTYECICDSEWDGPNCDVPVN